MEVHVRLVDKTKSDAATARCSCPSRTSKFTSGTPTLRATTAALARKALLTSRSPTSPTAASQAMTTWRTSIASAAASK
jgi:hypothetical protein